MLILGGLGGFSYLTTYRQTLSLSSQLTQALQENQALKEQHQTIAAQAQALQKSNHTLTQALAEQREQKQAYARRLEQAKRQLQQDQSAQPWLRTPVHASVRRVLKQANTAP